MPPYTADEHKKARTFEGLAATWRDDYGLQLVDDEWLPENRVRCRLLASGTKKALAVVTYAWNEGWEFRGITWLLEPSEVGQR